MSSKDEITKSDLVITESLQTEAQDSLLLEDGNLLGLETQSLVDDISATASCISTLTGDLSLTYSILAEGATLETSEAPLTINAVLTGQITARSQFGVNQELLLEDGGAILIDPDTSLGIETKETALKATARLSGSINSQSTQSSEISLAYTLHAEPANLRLETTQDSIKVEQELQHTIGTLLTGTFTGSGSTVFNKLQTTGIVSLEAGVARTGFEKLQVYGTGKTTIPPRGVNPNEIWFRNRQQLRAKYGWGVKDLTRYVTN